MIGILGGTFDPVHAGHLQVARQVLERLRPERVDFMPCASPVHRGRPAATAHHRRAMIELAIGPMPGIGLNPVELERDGPSYTVDSLRALRRETRARLLLIVGSDAFNGFTRWRSPRQILELAHLVICHRPGQPPDPGLYPERRVGDAATLAERPAGAVLLLETDPNPCSSTALREALAAGESVAECLPEAVAAYIEKHRLYRK